MLRWCRHAPDQWSQRRESHGCFGREHLWRIGRRSSACLRLCQRSRQPGVGLGRVSLGNRRCLYCVKKGLGVGAERSCEAVANGQYVGKLQVRQHEAVNSADDQTRENDCSEPRRHAPKSPISVRAEEFMHPIVTHNP